MRFEIERRNALREAAGADASFQSPEKVLVVPRGNFINHVEIENRAVLFEMRRPAIGDVVIGVDLETASVFVNVLPPSRQVAARYHIRSDQRQLGRRKE